MYYVVFKKMYFYVQYINIRLLELLSRLTMDIIPINCFVNLICDCNYTKLLYILCNTACTVFHELLIAML